MFDLKRRVKSRRGNVYDLVRCSRFQKGGAKRRRIDGKSKRVRVGTQRMTLCCARRTRHEATKERLFDVHGNFFSSNEHS